MVRNIVGTVVRGDDLFGRDNFIEQIWQKLETTNILLAAPRRFGKTSVMYNLLDQPRSGFRVIHFDLEPVAEPVDFVVTLLDKLRRDKKFMSLIRKGKKFIENIEFGISVGNDVEFKINLKQKIEKNWKEVGKEIFNQLETSNQKILLIFDEFAMMIENFLDDRLSNKEVREFLHWFRQLRIDPSMTKCRFVIGSSISIDHHLSKLNVAASLNDFEKMVLGEFDNDKVALSFIDRLFEDEEVKISKQNQKKILELTGPPIPYFIQILVSEIIKKYSRKSQSVKSKEIEIIYHDTVLGVSCKSYFQHYYDRLWHYEPANEKAAKQLLKKLAITGEVKRGDLYQQYLKEIQRQSDMDGFNNLMSDLENDFYIKFQSSNKSYVFFSKILRDWWKRYYSL